MTIADRTLILDRLAEIEASIAQVEARLTAAIDALHAGLTQAITHTQTGEPQW